MSDNLVHALAGSGGGMVAMLLTYPLSTVSSRLQVQHSENGSNSYKSNLDAVKKIINTEGLNGLYSGLESALLGIALTNGIYYYFYEMTKSGLRTALKKRGQLTVADSMIAGAVAGSATVLVTNPIWVVNTRIATRKNSIDEKIEVNENKNNKLSSFKALSLIIKQDGVKALWQGVIPALILVINPIIQYTVFEQAKLFLEKRKKLGNFDFFILGALSKLIATTITYPYIVVKSRMQLRQSSNQDLRYDSVLDSLLKIIKKEGIPGLYKGIHSKLLQSMLTAAILFSAKEALFKYTTKLLFALTRNSRR